MQACNYCNHCNVHEPRCAVALHVRHAQVQGAENPVKSFFGYGRMRRQADAQSRCASD
jgi:hypothetical protein